MIHLKINGINTEISSGSSIYDACKKAGVYVPTLCNHPDVPPAGNCGICVVKVNGTNFVLSCATKAQNGMIVETNTPEVKKRAFDALTSFSEMALMPSTKEIEDVWNYFSNKRPKRARHAECTNAVSFDPSLCINCGRCTRMCSDVQNIGALDEDSHSLNENECIQCGQCITVCPTKALKAHSSISGIVRALSTGKTLVLQVAPSVRVSIGECFGEPIGSIVTGKIVAAAKEIGFRYVFDTDFGADLTVIEESTELVSRVKEGGVLPMFTSCCPSWVNFVEKLHPELIPNLSTSKSPHLMTGAIIKTYFAEKKLIDPKNLYVVSLMPCTAKKDEIRRDQLVGDVDCSITSVEFADLIVQFEIDWSSLPNIPFDRMLGESSGSAALFGVSGGVAEAAIRYIHERVTNSKLGSIEYQQCRGYTSIRTATVQFPDLELKIAICNGISKARDFIESGDFASYHFVEVMACPYGCIGGGGQPMLNSRAEAEMRANSIYQIDKQFVKSRTANDNSEVTELFTSFLGHPNEGLAHTLLHTHYRRQDSPLIEMKRKLGTMPIVAFGSQSGHTSKLARVFAGYIGSIPTSLNSCSIQSLIKRGTAIILCSTHGSGEFPNNALNFAKALKECPDDLSSLRFAVCAVGSKDYPMFCFAGRMLDKLLVQHGAKRLMPIIEIDTSTFDHGEGLYEIWAESIIHTLGLKIPEKRLSVSYEVSITKNDEDSIHTNPERPKEFDYGVMISSTVLTPENIEPQMHRYQIKLPMQMTYEAGDHVSILPQNDIETTNAVIRELKLDPKSILSVTTNLPEGFSYIPHRVTIYQLFLQYIDLNGIPNRNLLRAFQQYTNDQFSKERIGRILNPQEPRFFNDFVQDTSVGEFILEYARYGYPPLDLFLSVTPQIRPRVYCTASAPTGASRTVDLIINDCIFGLGNSRRGLCTSFLRRFGLTKLAIKTQKGSFNYPKDPTTPVIMAALGCGIAPMLSLLQHRENTQGEQGDAALYFGCRFKNSYPLLDTILQNYVEQGSLQHLRFAYSREGTTKTYITDLMMDDADKIWSFWKNPKTTVFYCGPSRTLPDQLHEIFVKITMDKGKMNREQAEKFSKLHPHKLVWF